MTFPSQWSIDCIIIYKINWLFATMIIVRMGAIMFEKHNVNKTNFLLLFFGFYATGNKVFVIRWNDSKSP